MTSPAARTDEEGRELLRRLGFPFRTEAAAPPPTPLTRGRRR